MTTTEMISEPIEGFQSRMSESDFEAWALRANVNAEWVDGEVILMAPSNEDHSEAVNWLFVLLKMFVDKHQLGRAMQTDFMVRLPKRRRLPDLFFVSKNSKAKFTRTYLQGAPDLIVEIVSPDSESRDWRDKYLDYQSAGVREYWVIDPASQSAEFYALKRGKYAPMAVNDGVIRSQVVADFWIKVDWLWQHPSPNVYELAKELGIV
jgi:Uma2 family endonuclease